MKKFFLLVATIVVVKNSVAQTGIAFTSFFSNKTLRIDLIHSGNATKESMSVIDMKALPYWSGSRKHLTDWKNYGNNYVEVYDSATGKLIYSRGFNSLFKEWQRLPEAHNKILSFYEVVEIPYPLATVKVVFYSRDFTSWKLKKMAEYYVAPDYYMIKHEEAYAYAPHELLRGDSLSYGKRLDIAFLAEGYTDEERGKFKTDAQRMADFLLRYEPFKSYKDKINFWIVLSASEESGTDDPVKGIYKKTVFNSSFNTFGSDRYLTTTDLRVVYDYADLVPHDQVYVLVNSDKYGGGGIFNFFSLTSVDNPASLLVFVHEFGHAFAGLADEYYYDEEDYARYYPDTIEPWEPNITSLVNFQEKWKNRVPDTVPVPTPDEAKYYNVVGVFEGAGYRSKGLYRPMHTCIMKELKAAGFCEVCKDAIIRRLKLYCE